MGERRKNYAKIHQGNKAGGGMEGKEEERRGGAL